MRFGCQRAARPQGVESLGADADEGRRTGAAGCRPAVSMVSFPMAGRFSIACQPTAVDVVDGKASPKWTARQSALVKGSGQFRPEVPDLETIIASRASVAATRPFGRMSPKESRADGEHCR